MDKRTILEEIVESVRTRLEQEKVRVPLAKVRAKAQDSAPPQNFQDALESKGNEVSIIAEAKRASPSAGLIAESYDPIALAQAYEAGGASALSVLTEPQYFQGELNHLSRIRKTVSLPILRKDFTIDSYQIYQARAAGADAILLIVRCLKDAELLSFQKLARELGMAALVEAHTPEEVDRAVACGATIIGVNNRNLANFTTDTKTSINLGSAIPKNCIRVAESGIHSISDIERLKEGGFRCFLIGEALMRASDATEKLRELRGIQS